MSDKELLRVRGFTISNQHGSIRFDGETDLLDVDLADIVTIEHMGVEVYDSQRH